MKRPPAQSFLPFGRSERVVNRQIRQRATGKKVTRGPGRPPKRNGREKHGLRPELAPRTAVHVTLGLRDGMPGLRTRRRFGAVAAAFRKFGTDRVEGFRLVHFAVLSNHLHLIVEADSKSALARG